MAGHSDDPTATIHLTEKSLESSSRFEAVPLMKVQSEGNGYALSAIQSLAVDESQNIIVLDNMNSELLVFDSSGVLLRKIGRRGNGPGEFSAPNYLAELDDTIFVLDRGLQVFRMDGGFQGTVGPSTGYAELEPFFTAERIEMSRSGPVFIRRRIATKKDVAGVWMDTLIISRLDRDYKTDPSWKPVHLILVEYALGKGLRGTRLMGAQPLIAVRPDGAVYFTVGDSLHIDVIEQDGRHTHIVANVPRVRTSSADAASYVDRLSVLIPSEFEIDRGASKIPSAEFKPVIGQLVVSATGCVALQRIDLTPKPFSANTQGQKSVWSFLDRDGTPTGQADLPLGFKAWVFHGNTVTGVLSNSGEAPSIVKYDIGNVCPADSRFP